MPRRTVTRIQYDCDICGKTFEGEPSQVLEINTGGDGRDCFSHSRVIVQADFSYAYTFEKSTICKDCKLSILSKILKVHKKE